MTDNHSDDVIVLPLPKPPPSTGPAPDRRQTAWQKHGSWVLLALSCLIFTGVGVQIGLTIGWSNLQTIVALKNDELQRMRNDYITANRELTDKLAKAVEQSSNAASSAAKAAQEAGKSQPQ